MTTKGLRLVFTGGLRVEVEEYEVPHPGPDQILVRNTRSQISAGSEIGGFRAAVPGQASRRYPGYNTVGYVEEVGPGVQDYRPGDRVQAFGNHASHCLVDLVDGPPIKLPAGIPAMTMRQANGSYVDRLPDNVTDEQALFAVLGDVALHGVRRATLQIDESVAVFGMGVVGQLTLQFARLSGAYPIVAVDLFDSRLQRAKVSGATHFVNASRGDSAPAVRECTAGFGAQAVFHCSGNAQLLQTCMEAAADRAKVVLTGSAPGTAQIGLQVELLRHELSIVGVYESALHEPHAYWPWTRQRNREACRRLISSGELKVDHLISHVVPPSRAQEMYSLIAAGGEDWMSIIFAWD